MSDTLSREEWCRRYRQRLIDVAGVTEAQAQAELEAGTVEYLIEDYEDDPEGSADVSMSYWEP